MENKYILPLILLLLCLPCIGYSQGVISLDSYQKESRQQEYKETRNKVNTTTKTESQSSKDKSKQQIPYSQPDGYVNGHGCVDLGLPSGNLWATTNLGALSPLKIGDKFYWGTNDSKQPAYSKLFYKTLCDQNRNISSHYAYDASTYKLGKPWRMPLKKDLEELLRECRWEKISIDSTEGYLITGKNKKTIFIPLSGFWLGECEYDQDIKAYYPLFAADRGQQGHHICYLLDINKYPIRPIIKQ